MDALEYLLENNARRAEEMKANDAGLLFANLRRANAETSADRMFRQPNFSQYDNGYSNRASFSCIEISLTSSCMAKN